MRKHLAILFCAAILSLAANANEAIARDNSYRSVAVDTSRIAATGHRHLAGMMKPMLAGEISKAMGPRLGQRGGQLVVRITKIRIPPTGGDSDADAANADRIEGVVIIPGRGAIPIRVQLPPSQAGAWYLEEYNERRVYRLIEAFAQWVAREA
ncbi:MAG: hypothetical protein IPK23_15595 [Rhizobiales bacterium]|jgi:hypothetical protein|nr:hypothetical protein [Hyphomicrobiales bacterium]